MRYFEMEDCIIDDDVEFELLREDAAAALNSETEINCLPPNTDQADVEWRTRRKARAEWFQGRGRGGGSCLWGLPAAVRGVGVGDGSSSSS